MGEDRLTDDEVARVLRRASELDLGVSTALATGDGLPVEAVEAAAAEVGLSAVAVRQAVAELRTGALDEQGTPIVCARVVPLSQAAALEAVGRFLARQAMARARDRGGEEVWRPREDWIAGMQRKLDWAKSIRLRSISEVVVRTVEVEGGTLVRLVAQPSGAVASAPGIGATTAGSVGAFVVGGLGLLNGDPELVFGAVGAASGGGLGAFGGWRVGRRIRDRQRWRVAEAIDGVLDELERGRSPGGRNALDRLARRARRVRGGWTA
jgi:hypothetical protein